VRLVYRNYLKLIPKQTCPYASCSATLIFLGPVADQARTTYATLEVARYQEALLIMRVIAADCVGRRSMLILFPNTISTRGTFWSKRRILVHWIWRLDTYIALYRTIVILLLIESKSKSPDQPGFIAAAVLGRLIAILWWVLPQNY